MAKIEQRKARKDYPANGIKKGDTYFFVAIKTGPRSSRTIRSLTPPKRWELTGSAFYSELWQIEDEGFQNINSGDDLKEVAERVRELGETAQESFDNMPEGLQQGQTGETLQERADSCSSWADDIENAGDELETALTDFDEAVQAWADFKPTKEAYDKALADWEDQDEDDRDDEPEEPDAPDLPDDMDEESIFDEDRIAERRQEIIDEHVTNATDANPGIN